MRIAVIGNGYVGLVTATCFAESGNQVIGVEKDVGKLELLSSGKSPIYEPGLADLLGRNLHAGRLHFTHACEEAVAASQVVFIAVGTPPKSDGSADLSAIDAVAETIGRCLARETTVVNKSTVPVGTGDRIEAILRRHAKLPFFVASNPEFLKEGTAVSDFLRPERVVIGANEPEPAQVIAELHAPFVSSHAPILRISRRAAELSKYAANAYLATRISFINEIATLCERCAVDVDEVREAIGADTRIGHHFMSPGLGYGGSCFPKDVQALAANAATVGVDAGIMKAVHQRNLAQREQMLQRILGRLGPSLKGRRLAVWGLSFKPNTDDVREAPALTIIEALLARGAAVSAYDPVAAPAARPHLDSRVTLAPDAYAALDNADALLICTEWDEFRHPDFETIRTRLKTPLIFDGRNIFPPQQLADLGFEYHSVGRPPPPAGRYATDTATLVGGQRMTGIGSQRRVEHWRPFR